MEVTIDDIRSTKKRLIARLVTPHQMTLGDLLLVYEQFHDAGVPDDASIQSPDRFSSSHSSTYFSCSWEPNDE